MDISCGEKVLSEDYADYMIDEGKALNELTTIQDICSFNLIDNTYNVYIPISKLPNNMLEAYGFGAYPNCYGVMDMNSLDKSGITQIQNIPNFQLQGEGVLIGLVDTGIDYQHEAFIKEDGTSKILSIWDQSINSDFFHPEKFPYGTEYSQSQINLALKSENPLSVVPSTDEDGHGTYLAGIAAGNRNEKEKFSGVAPKAELVVVKLKQAKRFLQDFWRIPNNVLTFQKNDLIMGLRYLEDFSAKAQQPMSIIIGIGTSQGAHDERGALSTYISNLASKEGICLTICGGNEGNTGHHYMGKVEKNPDLVELMVGSNVSGFSMEFWGSSPTNYSIDIKSPTGEYIPRIAPRATVSREIKLIFGNTTINVDYKLVESQSGEQLILLRFTNPLEGLWTFNVYSGGNLSFNYHCWLPIEQFLSSETHFNKPNADYTLTSPGNTFIPIVMTAYNTDNEALYINASRGYMRTENIAPTLAAPGVNLIGPNIPSGYKKASGTSVAAAHTAGVGAMLLEWGNVKNNYPEISTVEIRNIFIRGARRDPNIMFPNKKWGYGILDLYNAFDIFRST
ncbi:MAG: S8 family peptidase [Lachnotalea sp.]